ncbi:MAG: hypothetical protein ACOX5Z_02420 [Desulfobulbus sp.]
MSHSHLVLAGKVKSYLFSLAMKKKTSHTTEKATAITDAIIWFSPIGMRNFSLMGIRDSNQIGIRDFIPMGMRDFIPMEMEDTSHAKRTRPNSYLESCSIMANIRKIAPCIIQPLNTMNVVETENMDIKMSVSRNNSGLIKSSLGDARIPMNPPI